MHQKEKDYFLSPWREKLQLIREGFPSPWRESATDKRLETAFSLALSQASALKHSRHYEGGAALKSYLGSPNIPDYSLSKKQVMNQETNSYEKLIPEIVSLFEGLPNWNHPQAMCNVNPSSNMSSLIASTLCNLFNPDIIEGEYSWNAAKAEIETGAMLAELIGWDPEKAGGVYTFGGTGSYLYAMKYALTQLLGKEALKKGVREDVKLLVSETGHYAKETATDWTGLGVDNVINIQSDEDNRMDIIHLEEAMKACYDAGTPIVMITATVGTTDAFAIDPILEIRYLIDHYKNAKGYKKPLLYADAVIGWSWAAFKNYNFSENPLEFSNHVLEIIKENYRQIKHLHLVDAMSVDFHKTGWAPYNSSFFFAKDYEKFTSSLQRAIPPYLQTAIDYNPYLYTLETSRAASGALAGWASLKFFGYTGYRVIMGRIVEITHFFRQLLEKEANIVCINPKNYGFVTLFRVYPPGINAQEQYKREKNDPGCLEELKANNALQKMVANKLFDMLRDEKSKVQGWENPPYTSYTDAARYTNYAKSDEGIEVHLISALKAFLMSPFSNEISILLVRNYVLKARDLVISELKEKQSGSTDKRQKTEKEELEKIHHWYGDEEEGLIINYLSSLEAKEKISLSAAKEQPSYYKAQRVFKKEQLCGELKDKYSFDEQNMLRNISLFSAISTANFKELLKKSECSTYENDTYIFYENDRAEDFYIILEGQVSIVKKEGREDKQLVLLSKGDFFGEMSVFENGRRAASAKVFQGAKLLKIYGGDFIDLAF